MSAPTTGGPRPGHGAHRSSRRTRPAAHPDRVWSVHGPDTPSEDLAKLLVEYANTRDLLRHHRIAQRRRDQFVILFAVVATIAIGALVGAFIVLLFQNDLSRTSVLAGIGAVVAVVTYLVPLLAYYRRRKRDRDFTKLLRAVEMRVDSLTFSEMSRVLDESDTEERKSA